MEPEISKHCERINLVDGRVIVVTKEWWREFLFERKRMTPGKEMLAKIKSDPRYARGIAHGVPRPGHAEGTVEKHLYDLAGNLLNLLPMISEEEFWKLAILIHVHDTFKVDARPDSPIKDPQSHASLARMFLSEFTDDLDLLQMVQYHDEGLALYMQAMTPLGPKAPYNQRRMRDNVLTIKNLELFLIFTIIDGYTPSKDHAKIRWFIDEVNKHVQTPRAYKAMEVFGL